MDSAWRSVCAGWGLPAAGSVVGPGVRLPVVCLSVVVKNFGELRHTHRRQLHPMIMAALAGTAASWIKACAASLSVKPRQVEAAAHLLKQDATPPFIVRYRADATGGLDEPQVLEVRRALGEFEALQDRRAVVLKALGQKQGIPASLLDAVRDCESLSELEQLSTVQDQGGHACRCCALQGPWTSR